MLLARKLVIFCLLTAFVIVDALSGRWWGMWYPRSLQQGPLRADPINAIGDAAPIFIATALAGGIAASLWRQKSKPISIVATAIACFMVGYLVLWMGFRL